MADENDEFETLNVEFYYFKLDSSNVDFFLAKQGYELLIKAMGFSIVSEITVDKIAIDKVYDIGEDCDYTILEAYIVKRPNVGYKFAKGIKIPSAIMIQKK